MGFLLLIPVQIHLEVTWGLSQPCTQAEVEEWVPGKGCCPPQGVRGEWVPQNKTQKQQEEGKADKNAQSSCGNVGNVVTPQLAVTHFVRNLVFLS